jgi:heme oxygenase
VRDAHRALRDATRDEHDRVDAIFGRFDLTDRRSYIDFLLAHAKALLPVEVALDAAGARTWFPDWPDRRRGRLLELDLSQLDSSAASAAPFTLAAHVGDVAGAVYVLEGSRLGGRYLARRVAPALPTSYLDAPQPPGAWPKLLERLDVLLADGEMANRALASARAVFARFEDAGRTWMA